MMGLDRDVCVGFYAVPFGGSSIHLGLCWAVAVISYYRKTNKVLVLKANGMKQSRKEQSVEKTSAARYGFSETPMNLGNTSSHMNSLIGYI